MVVSVRDELPERAIRYLAKIKKECFDAAAPAMQDMTADDRDQVAHDDKCMVNRREPHILSPFKPSLNVRWQHGSAPAIMTVMDGLFAYD